MFKTTLKPPQSWVAHITRDFILHIILVRIIVPWSLIKSFKASKSGKTTTAKSMKIHQKTIIDIFIGCIIELKNWIELMNCFCGMVDRRKAFSLISSRDHCQRSSPSWISDTPRAGFEDPGPWTPPFQKVTGNLKSYLEKNKQTKKSKSNTSSYYRKVKKTV